MLTAGRVGANALTGGAVIGALLFTLVGSAELCGGFVPTITGGADTGGAVTGGAVTGTAVTGGLVMGALLPP